MEKGNKNKGLVTLIIILFIVVIGLSILFYFYSQKENTQKSINNQQGINNEPSKIVAEVKKSDKVIPYINIKNSKNAERINKEIEEVYESNNERVEDAITYETYTNGDMLSLVVTVVGLAKESREYYVYNVNSLTGENVSNFDILAKTGFSESDYLASLKIAMGNKFEEMFGHGVHDNWYNTMLEKTIASDNYSTENRMYINGKGVLCVIGKIYSMAGAESYSRMVEVTKNLIPTQIPEKSTTTSGTVQALSSNLGDLLVYNGDVYYSPTGIGKVVANNVEGYNISKIGKYGEYSYPKEFAYDGVNTFKAYKLNMSNVASVYEIAYGQGTEDYAIILLSKDGKISTITKGANELVMSKELPKYSNIVNVYQNYSMKNANYATLIDKNGNEYSFGNISEIKNKSQLLSSTLGDLLVYNGDVYYSPTGIGKVVANNVEGYNISKIGKYGEYSYPKEFAYDGVNTFKAYKLNISNVASVYEIAYGQGTEDYVIILLSKDGKISTITKGVNELVVNKELSRYSNIVNVYQNYSMKNANYATLIDKNGNEYRYGAIGD